MSIDLTTFLDSLIGTAGTWFNGLLPIFALVVGLTLGIGIFYLVIRAIKNALPGI